VSDFCFHLFFINQSNCRKSSVSVAAFVKSEEDKKKAQSKEKAHVDLAFFKKLYRILRIATPGIFTAEVGLFFNHNFI
jgi:hypothetical protein